MATGHIVIKWRIEVALAADGAGPMGAVPSASTLVQSNDFGANGGFVVVPGGSSPTGANLTTAGVTVGAAIGTALNLAANLALIQGMTTGATP